MPLEQGGRCDLKWGGHCCPEPLQSFGRWGLGPDLRPVSWSCLDRIMMGWRAPGDAGFKARASKQMWPSEQLWCYLGLLKWTFQLFATLSPGPEVPRLVESPWWGSALGWMGGWSDCGQEPVRRPLGFSRQEIKTKAKTLDSIAPGTQEAPGAFLRKDVGVTAGWHVVKVDVWEALTPVRPGLEPRELLTALCYLRPWDGCQTREQ